MSNSRRRIGKWTIEYSPKPIPDRRFDYDIVHDDYEPGNGLCSSVDSIESAMLEIQRMEEEILDNVP
jgi:hypothetical protein